uniref:CD44 antigen n=1 Tax=Sphenodon punctatus TaxID=8508 RepID=A0A8D0HJM5_SPHPU
MTKFLLYATFGLCSLQLCLAHIGLNISCRYAGVFHVEKGNRYSLTRDEAIRLCRALNSTLPTWEQMEKAYVLGFETCRYGYIEEKIVVPRKNPYHLCAANNTGIYILTSNTSQRYDTYCFNTSETKEKACDPITKLYSDWPDDQNITDIFNADGSRYIGGKRYTEATPVTEDDNNLGSGSASGRGTPDPAITGGDVTSRPDVYPGEFTSTRITRIPAYIPGGDDEKERQPTSTIVVSNDLAKNEDSTQDPLMNDIHPGIEKEDKYPTNSTADDVLPGVIPPIQRDPKNETHHKVSTTDQHGNKGSRRGQQNVTPSPGQIPIQKKDPRPRSSHIPDWLIVLCSLLALALILGVCVAVNSRRRCGQKKKLVINNGKGAVEDRKLGELNGEASKSHEMVHLVNKEQPGDRTGPCDDFLTTDETRNQQDVDLKTGV